MKKILAIILTLAIIAVSIPMTYVFAIGEKAEYSVTANKTTAVAGDEIEFAVKIDLLNKMTAFEFTLDIPSGLTLVSGSQTAIARDDLGFDNVNNNESALLVSGYGSNPYTATGTLTLATFKCTVDSNAVGKYTVGLKDTVLNDDEYEEEAHDVTSVEINVVIPTTGISIKETTTLTEGNTEQLTATLTPANATDTVLWTSNDDSVATVSSTGLVTAVKKGTATITATAGNVSDTCTVTVNCAHTNTTPYSPVPSTCKVQGHAAYTKCDDCGAVISGSDAKLPLADHTYGEWIPEVPATHDANGVKGHYHCSVCEKNFDSEMNELSSLVITKDANHGLPAEDWKSDATYHWHECKVVGCGVVIDSTKAEHTFEWKTDKPATEDETGLKHEECSVCGYKRNEGTVIDKLDHTHTGITHHDAVAATCKATGNIEYWTCSSAKCSNKYYSDSLCQNEITTGIITSKDSSNHDGETEYRNSKPATCYEDGYEGDIYCLGCNTKIGEGNSIQKLSHTPGDWETDADYHWKECTVVACGVVIDGSKAKHTFEWKEDKPATEDETGVKHEECSVCGYKKNENTPIEKLPHTHIGITHHDAVAATCKATGNIEYWTCSSAKCSGKYFSDELCQNEITTGITTAKNSSNHVGGTEYRNSKTTTCYEEGYEGDIYCLGCNTKIGEGESIQKLSHTPGDWETDANYHWKECTVVACGVVIDGSKATHTFEWKIDKAATEDETGVKHEECSVCGYKRNEGTVINKLDHKHTVVHHYAVPAGCKSEGNIEYWTCSSEKCVGKYYSEETCTLTVDNVIVLPDENNHIHTEIRDKKDATCTEDGYTGDTYCKDCGKKIKDGEVIKATAHEFQDGKCKVCDAKDPNYTPTSPKTGDNSHMTLWIILASVSCLGVLGSIFTKKKKSVR